MYHANVFFCLMMVIPVLSLLVTMVTRCQSMWHLQLSSRSELRNHGDGEGGELCVSRFRWGCRLLPCLAQRLPGQAQRQGGCFRCWSLDSKSEEGQKEVEEEAEENDDVNVSSWRGGGICAPLVAATFDTEEEDEAEDKEKEEEQQAQEQLQ